MKNYYKTLSDLRIAEQRRATLEEKKHMLLESITSTTSKLKEDVTQSSGFSNDKYDKYMVRCEEIDIELEELEQEIIMLKGCLKKMDDILKNISGIEERIFRLYYIESKTPTQISFIVPCDRTTVYRYIKKIKQKI